MPATCYNCGLPFNDSTGAGCCVPCDFLIKAVEPPEELKDMRWVYQGKRPGTRGQMAWAKLMTDDPGKFLAEKRAAERDYRIAVAARMPKVAEPEPEIVANNEQDEGTARVLELLAEEWELVKAFQEKEHERRKDL